MLRMKNNKSSYPDQISRILEDLDNLGIWINGNSYWCGIEDYISEKVSELENRKRDLERQLKRYHTKTVKGKKYWYKAENGKWIYLGKEDPTQDLRKEIEKLKRRIERTRDDICSCIVHEAGDHLIINIKKFKEKVSEELPEDIVVLREVIKCLDIS